MFRSRRVSRGAWSMFCAVVVAGSVWLPGVEPAWGQADDRWEPPFGMQAFTYRQWKRQYVALSDKIALVNGQYVACPAYDPRYPSSVGVTLREVKRKMSREEVEVSGLMVRYREIEPPKAEAQALAMALPSLDVGAYGWVQAVRVDEILGPREMVVSRLRLIDEDELRDDMRDAERRADGRDAQVEQAFQYRRSLAERQGHRPYREDMRITGFATADLAERQWWRGPDDGGLQIAVVRHEVDDSGYREQRRRVAISVELLENRIGETEFFQLHHRQGLDGKAFLKLVAEVHREHRGAEDEATRALLARLVPTFRGAAEP